MQEFVSVASLVGSLVLVAITAWYAWQTQAMVREMRDTRRASSRPDVRLDIELFGGGVMSRVENVGSGPAIGIFVNLELRSSGSDVVDSTTWHTPVLRPGEHRFLDFPRKPDTNLYQLKEMHEQAYWLELRGVCEDLARERQTVNSSVRFDDRTRRNREVGISSPDTDTAAQLKAIAKEVEGLRRAVERKP